MTGPPNSGITLFFFPSLAQRRRQGREGGGGGGNDVRGAPGQDGDEDEGLHLPFARRSSWDM